MEDENRSGNQEVRTLVVDDQESFRDILRQLVGVAPGFTLAGEATSGEEAIDAVQELSPQMVLMDVRMPGMGGIEAARNLAAHHPQVVVILISVHGPEELPPDLIEAGKAAAFVLKQNLRPRLLRDLWRAYQPERARPPYRRSSPPDRAAAR